MLREEQRLREEVKRLLAEAEQTDKGRGQALRAQPARRRVAVELGRREERLQRIAEAKKALEVRARAEAEEKQKDKQDRKCKKYWPTAAAIARRRIFARRQRRKSTYTWQRINRSTINPCQAVPGDASRNRPRWWQG